MSPAPHDDITKPSKNPAENGPSRAIICTVLAAIALSVGILYGKTAWFDFVTFDDADYVTQNLHVQAGLTWESVRWAFTTFHGANWIPVTWLSHMLDAQIFGSWSGGHHITSVLLHVLNSLLLVLLLYRITFCFWKSALVAALFALHPLHVESVAWISERKDLLSTLFFLATMFAYFNYTERRTLPRYLSVMILFALGLMAKPMLVSLPLVLLLLDWWPLQRFSATYTEAESLSDRTDKQQILRSILTEKIPLLLMSLASAVITILAQKQGEAVVSTQVLPLFQRIGRMFIHYCWYLGKLSWPTDLAFYYPVETGLSLWKFAAAATCIIAMTFITLRSVHSRRFIATGWLWFLITLLPVIGLVAVGMQGTADRYAYIPSIGIFIAVVWLADDLRVKTDCRYMPPIVISAALLGILALLTWRQVDTWRNGSTLSEHAVTVTKDNYVAMTIMGDTLDDDGRNTQAIGYYNRALQIRPEYDIARNSLGVALCRQGRTEEAMREFSNAVRLRPSYADAYVNMGVCELASGHRDEAALFFRQALTIKPDHFAAAEYLSQALNSPKKNPNRATRY